MTNYELFKALREDFFVEVEENFASETQKSQIRELFSSSFARTLFHFIENGTTIKD